MTPFQIDVRSERGTYPVLIGSGVCRELPARLAEIPEDREIVTVCKVGMRSFNAAGWLRQLGRKAVSLQGGMDRWKTLGLPVTR
jgi:rhodanese-related sulfurtransferase